MNCCHNLNYLFDDEISCIEGDMWNSLEVYPDREFARVEIARLIDHMGLLAAQSQDLQFPSTTFDTFVNSKERIYVLKYKRIYKMRGAILGFVRVGWRPITVEDLEGFISKRDMFCLLDIYVARDRQRQGHAKRLMDFVLLHENLEPWDVVISQPNPAILSFFTKHYNLRDFMTAEDGKYLVWRRYMTDNKPTGKSGVRYLQPAHTYTSNSRDYLGGPWPPSVKGGTDKDHPFSNFHPPNFAVPAFHDELSPQDLRLAEIRKRRHENNDTMKRLVRECYKESDNNQELNYGPTVPKKRLASNREKLSRAEEMRKLTAHFGSIVFTTPYLAHMHLGAT